MMACVGVVVRPARELFFLSEGSLPLRLGVLQLVADDSVPACGLGLTIWLEMPLMSLTTLGLKCP